MPYAIRFEVEMTFPDGLPETVLMASVDAKISEVADLIYRHSGVTFDNMRVLAKRYKESAGQGVTQDGSMPERMR